MSEMNEADNNGFKKHIANICNGRKMMINRLDLHEETWKAALEYERARVSPLDALSLYDKLEKERAKSQKLVESLKSFCQCEMLKDYNINCGACNTIKEYSEEK